jgi:hypothetical protein
MLKTILAPARKLPPLRLKTAVEAARTQSSLFQQVFSILTQTQLPLPWVELSSLPQALMAG